MKKNLIISNCEDCTHSGLKTGLKCCTCHNIYESWVCELKNGRPLNEETMDETIPDWCPLEDADVKKD